MIAVAVLLLALVVQVADAKPALPTGVDVTQIPHSPGFYARGDRAREWVVQAQQTIRGQRNGTPVDPDSPIPDRSGSPWLVLIGPDDATAQAEAQLPEELRSRVQVARYTPEDPRLDRGFRRYYSGGTTAVILESDRTVAWSGLCDVREIVIRLRRLLGLEPEPSPLFPDLPIPLPSLPDFGGPSVLTSFLGTLGALLFARLLGGLGPLLGRLILAAARASVAEATKPPDPPRPN